jgi:hypothetical protein
MANSGNWAYVVNITTTNQQQPANTNQPTPDSQSVKIVLYLELKRD